MIRIALAAALVAGSAFVGAACDGEIRLRSTVASPDATDGASAIDGGPKAEECVDDRSCLPGLHCELESKTCVECLVDTHCGVGHPRCDVALHRCVECGSSLDCSNGATCEPTTRRCVSACTDGAVCPSETPTCEPQRSLCVACIGDADCDGAATGPVCDVAVGRCVQCTDDSECSGTSPYCDPVALSCVDCTSSSECPWQCDLSTGRCVTASDAGAD